MYPRERPATGHDAREHDLVVAVDEATLDPRFVGAVAHERRIGPAAAQQVERVDDERLARAGLAGDHGHARAERQQQVGDDPEVLDAQLDQHRRSPIRKVELGFEHLVEVARAQAREAQRFGAPPRT